MQGISEDGWVWSVEEGRGCKRGQSRKVRTRTEWANAIFRQKDYLSLLVSSHIALIDRMCQERIGFCSLATDLRSMVHTVQHSTRPACTAMRVYSSDPCVLQVSRGCMNQYVCLTGRTRCASRGFSSLIEMYLATVRKCLALHDRAVLKYPYFIMQLDLIQHIYDKWCIMTIRKQCVHPCPANDVLYIISAHSYLMQSIISHHYTAHFKVICGHSVSSNIYRNWKSYLCSLSWWSLLQVSVSVGPSCDRITAKLAFVS